MNKIVVCAAALFATTGAAMAADLPAPTYSEPTPAYYAAPHDWTGFYAGVVGGFGWGEVTSPGGGEADINGLLIGGTVGANWQMDSFVFGAEGDLSWSGIEGSNSGSTFDEDYLATLRARVGYSFSDVLVYGTAGFVMTGATVSGSSVSSSDTYYGWTIGVGAEYALTEALSAKVEYLYADYGDTSITLGGTPGDIGLKTHAIRAGVNYKF